MSCIPSLVRSQKGIDQKHIFSSVRSRMLSQESFSTALSLISMYHIQKGLGCLEGSQIQVRPGGRASRKSKMKTPWRVDGNRRVKSMALFLQQHFPGSCSTSIWIFCLKTPALHVCLPELLPLPLFLMIQCSCFQQNYY